MDGGVTRPRVGLALVVAATVLGLMGTDLVLPAIPSLPEALGGDPGAAQLVIAAYVAGTGVGLLAFGALGDRLATRTLFVASLLLTPPPPSPAPRRPRSGAWSRCARSRAPPPPAPLSSPRR